MFDKQPHIDINAVDIVKSVYTSELITETQCPKQV